MTVSCRKCGYKRKPEDTAPGYECPKCKVIYDKYNPTPKSRSSDTQSDSNQVQMAGVRKVRFFIALVFITAGLVYFWYTWSAKDSFFTMLGIWPILIGIWIGGSGNVHIGDSGHYNIGGEDNSNDGSGGGDL